MFKVGNVTYGERDLNFIILKWAVNKINREKGFNYMTILKDTDENEKSTEKNKA